MELLPLVNNETATVTTVNQQYKTQQMLSIILIGIIGARYGQEVEQTKQSNAPIKGFTVDSPEMILKLSANVLIFIDIDIIICLHS